MFTCFSPSSNVKAVAYFILKSKLVFTCAPCKATG